ncbi:MAG TPA: class I SAM-dependent methyltransferase [Candidatus Krumholzibacteria bacterium]|nr:class I SAM-dependent methyltransferase [Candidatus Krumholzibacteria bacterium]HPD71790.1 class I SAM-dependent methyltransferase [Candidatus Krumholzibacteria bacterium]HRY41277.1 class I SAM-dependent methyltransferase [Candidatus Krumholzibacteria bacterium]
MEELLPPGTWCTDWAFLREVDRCGARSFVEVGCGEGRLGAVLCERGLVGVGVEPSPEAAARCRLRLAGWRAERRFRLHEGPLADLELDRPADLVFSQMVLEHVADDLALVRSMLRHVRPGGTVIAVVPGRPERWGAEDELSGHLRRYDRLDLAQLFLAAGLDEISVKSLNVPVTNLLHRVSDAVVARHLAPRAGLDQATLTRLSGLSETPLKHRFPAWFRLVLNPVAMWPFCHLQRAFFDGDRGHVLMAVGRRAAADREAAA